LRYGVARESFVWYVKRSVELITSVATWLEEMKQGLGRHGYLEQAKHLIPEFAD
jgi:hypothetical protein